VSEQNDKGIAREASAEEVWWGDTGVYGDD